MMSFVGHLQYTPRCARGNFFLGNAVEVFIDKGPALSA